MYTNKEFKIAFKRVLNCHPRILVHNVSRNFSGREGQRRMNRNAGQNNSYTQSFSGANPANTNSNNPNINSGYLSGMSN